MKYVQPHGITDPDASYINGNPSIGVQGSIPPAAAFEHPMRELVAIIDNNMLTPSETDLEQVAKGIRSQRMNYVVDTGSVNTLSVALDPPLGAYTIGLPIRVKIANTNTGSATIDAGAGRVPIRKPTGAEMAAGDLPASGLAEMVYDGTVFQMINFGGAGGGTGGNTFLVNIPYTVDTSLTANTIIANFSPAITSLSAGTLFMVKVANTNTSFTNINVNGLGNKPVYAQGGAPNWPLLPSDLVAGDVLIFTYDGTRFWIYANTILNQYVTFNIANNADFAALILALGRKRILTSGYVTIVLAAGIWSRIGTTHPNSDRITVAGTMLAAVPTYADFAKTGNSSAARAQDAANNLAMLRTRYATEIRFNNVAADYGGAVNHTGPGMMTFKNLLLVGQNVVAPGEMIAAIIGVAVGLGGAVYCLNVSIWGSGSYGFLASASDMTCENCFASSCQSYGFHAAQGGRMNCIQTGAYGNAQVGYCAERGASLLLFARQGVPGAPDLAGCQAIGNGIYGALTATMAGLYASRVNFTGNGVDLVAQSMAMASSTGSVLGSTSPASGVVGNSNSLIIVQ